MIGNELKVYDGLTSRQQLNLFRNLYYNDGNATEYGIIANAINDCFTADVVPKSEYDCLEKLYNDMTQEAKGYLNRLYGIRADVAREIFEEIEKIRSKEIHRCEVLREKETDPSERKYWEGGGNSLRQLSYWIAELKKKYTEGNET